MRPRRSNTPTQPTSAPIGARLASALLAALLATSAAAQAHAQAAADQRSIVPLDPRQSAAVSITTATARSPIAAAQVVVDPAARPQPFPTLESKPAHTAAPAGLNPSPTILSAPGIPSGFGYSVSGVGDVNNDGYADFVATTRNPGFTGWGAYLYLGGPSGPSSPTWSYESMFYPTKVAAAGDLNGDGYDDVAFGYGDASGAGWVEVRCGHSGSGLSDAPNFTVSASAEGFSIQTAGDVNGDGYADVIVGAPYASFPYAMIYFGSGAGLSLGNTQAIPAPVAGATHFGYAVAGLGDLNGDGYGDIAVGAPDDGPGAQGWVYFFMGTPSGVRLPYDFVYQSPVLGAVDWGATVAPAGDVNGDGYADVVMGDPNSSGDAFGPQGYAVIDGGRPTGGLIGLAAGGGFAFSPDRVGGDVFTAGDINGDGRADVLITATTGGYVRLYEAVNPGFVSNVGPITVGASAGLTARAAGDLNGDGFGDIVVGNPDAGFGQVRIYYGAADKPGAALARRTGSQDSELAGWSVAMGDVSGDGFDDVLVGKPTHDGAQGADCGAIELYLGGPAGLSATPVWTAEGLAAGGQLGISVAIGQDENGDGIGDILAGAHTGGYALLLYGRRDWAVPVLGQGWILNGPTGSYFGASVAFAGDVNGDGNADMLVGAPYYSNAALPGGGSHVGQVTLVMGSNLVPSFSAWAPVAVQPEVQEGSSVASAGDVNSDGYSDIVIGASLYDDPGNGNVDAGHARLYLGGPTGPSNTPTRQWIGASPGRMLGNSVAGLGDFDRDGYGDLAMGAFGIRTAYVVRGNASGVDANPTYQWQGDAFGGFGSSVAPAGDVDGDGSSDLLVGDVFFDGAGGADCGRMQVYPGGLAAGGAALMSWEGASNVDNLGHAIAGGGDVNGDGFADVVGGAPRITAIHFQGGGILLAMGNAARGDSTFAGRARPTHQGRGDYPGIPIGIYGSTHSLNQFGLESWVGSPGGRDRVAFEWRVDPLPFTLGATSGRTAWAAMGPPADTLQGAVPLTAAPPGLALASAFSWKLRQLSRSPYFRYGAWLNPQPNARDQWDFRTRATPADVALAPAAVRALELAAPWPSPARGEVHVEFALPRRANARLAVRDVQGRLVRTLADAAFDAGHHELSWDGVDASGRPCAPGLYLLDLSAGSERSSRRVVLIR